MLSKKLTTSQWFWPSLVYLASTLVFLWPLPLHFSSHIWGDRFDAWTTLWLMDHLHRAILSGTLSSTTTDILFPIGYNLWSFGHAALQLVGVGLMLLGVPLVSSYNLLLVAGLWTSALSAHGLGKTLSGDELGGWVAGIVFATSPYLYGEGAAGCIELVSAGFLPLYAWSIVWLARKPGWKRALISALVLAIIGPFNWYYTLFAGMMGVMLVIWLGLVGELKAVGWAVGAMLLAASLNAPLIPLVRRETPTRPPLNPAQLVDEQVWKDVASFSDGSYPLAELTPDFLETTDGFQVLKNATSLMALVEARFTVNPLQSTPGFLAFGVGILGAAAARRRGLGWAGIALGATILTLGPYIKLDDTPPLPEWAIDWTLPYGWAYANVPFFSKAYRPYRIAVIALTACAALGAVGMAALRLEWNRRWLQGGTLFLGGLAFTQPFWAGDRPALRPLADATIPALYWEFQKLPAGGVIELPLHYQPLTVANARFQYNQLAHQHPLLNCNQLIRRTDLLSFQQYVLQNSFLSLAQDLGRKKAPFSYTMSDLYALWKSGFRYVVLHTRTPADQVRLAGEETSADLIAEPAVSLLEDSFGKPVLQDSELKIYQIPEISEQDRRVLSWTGANLVEVPFALDAGRWGFFTPVSPEFPVVLWEGVAKKLSFWGRSESEVIVELVIQGEDTIKVPINLSAENWSWIELPVPNPEAVSISIESSDSSRIAIRRLQVQQ